MSSLNRLDFYQNFYKAHLRAYPSASNEENQKSTYTSWRTAKQKYKDAKEFEKFIQERINSLNLAAPKNTQKSVLSYFAKISKTSASTSTSSTNNTLASSKTSNEEKNVNQDSSATKSSEENSNLDVLNKSIAEEKKKIELKRKYSTPSQDELKLKIHAFESQLASLTMIRDSNLGGSEINAEIKKAKMDLKKNQAKLKATINNMKNQQKFRSKEKQKKILNKISAIEKSEENTLEENLQLQVGRPRKEVEYPDLLKTICDIAIFNSAADDRRQTEEIRTCTTLQDLTNKLFDKGIKISKSALYLRLLPKRSITLEGIRHVKTVPVRLCKPQNDLHKSHPDGKFCTATIRNVDTLASILGSKQVSYVSQDDKARVKIGITAANKQSSRLMHVEYRIKLPDHDWVIANKHSLIPSVYAGIHIKSNASGSPEDVSYSGPTYIAIRSGKHSSSTAATHSNDIQKLYELESFKEILYQNNQVKPVLIISVDGGPDENPRYHKTIAYAIEHFKKYSLDAIFIMTNAPGRSAFNRVERRMAPLSRALSGIILPHNFHGEHLNSKKETHNEELEKRNFAKAGEVLGEIWSQMVIDKYAVLAKYISHDEILQPTPQIDWGWHKKHVRESQYLLQIVKCTNRECCSEFNSDINMILKDRFLPPPLLIKRETNGRLGLTDPSEETQNSFFPSLFQQLSMQIPCEGSNFFILPYDYHCQSVKDNLLDRVCSFCDIYFASIKNVKEHRKVIHPSCAAKNIARKVSARVIKRQKNEALCIIKYKEKSEDAEWCDIEDLISMDVIEDQQPIPEDHLPVINSIGQWLQCDWTDDTN